MMLHWEVTEKTVEFVRKVTHSFDMDDNVLYDEFVLNNTWIQRN
jgi:hypothetical protein